MAEIVSLSAYRWAVLSERLKRARGIAERQQAAAPTDWKPTPPAADPRSDNQA